MRDATHRPYINVIELMVGRSSFQAHIFPKPPREYEQKVLRYCNTININRATSDSKIKRAV